MMFYAQLNQVISAVIKWTNEEQEMFFSQLRIKTYHVGDCLATKGNRCDYSFFINKGLVGYMLEDKNGNDFPAHFSFENDQTSSLAAFIDYPYMLTDLIALEDLQCVLIPHTAMRWLYENVKDGNKFGRIQYERILLLIAKRQRLNYIKDPLERLKLLTEIYPSIDRRISQRLISAVLKINEAHFSRLKSASNKNLPKK